MKNKRLSGGRITHLVKGINSNKVLSDILDSKKTLVRIIISRVGNLLKF